jgi:hypothetical protein
MNQCELHTKHNDYKIVLSFIRGKGKEGLPTFTSTDVQQGWKRLTKKKKKKAVRKE